MAHYQAQDWDMAQYLGRYEEPAADWSAAPARDVAPAPVAEDDWAGVLGFCHALRPAPAAGRPVAPAADAEDWGYGAHAL